MTACPASSPLCLDSNLAQMRVQTLTSMLSAASALSSQSEKEDLIGKEKTLYIPVEKKILSMNDLNRVGFGYCSQELVLYLVVK